MKQVTAPAEERPEQQRSASSEHTRYHAKSKRNDQRAISRENPVMVMLQTCNTSRAVKEMGVLEHFVATQKRVIK